MNVRPLHFCDVTVERAQWPVFGWAIECEADALRPRLAHLAHRERPWAPEYA